MKITRISALTGITHTREVPVTQDQLDRWTAGQGLIQNIMPDVSAADREFLISGSTPEEWDAIFGEDGA